MTTRDGNAQDHHHVYQYVGPYRLEKTLGKGQTGKFEKPSSLSDSCCQFSLIIIIIFVCSFHLISLNHLF